MPRCAEVPASEPEAASGSVSLPLDAIGNSSQSVSGGGSAGTYLFLLPLIIMRLTRKI